MSQTLNQRRAIAAYRSVQGEPSRRRDMRSNTNAWREQAVEQRWRTLPLPPRPQSAPDLVRPWVQNLVIGLVAVAAFALAIASGLGVL